MNSNAAAHRYAPDGGYVCDDVFRSWIKVTKDSVNWSLIAICALREQDDVAEKRHQLNDRFKKGVASGERRSRTMRSAFVCESCTP